MFNKMIAMGNGEEGFAYTNLKHGVIIQLNSGSSQTITCDFEPKLVIIGIGTQAIYARLMVLTADGKQDIDIGNNGNQEFVYSASDNVTISGNNVTVTMPLYWGNYGRVSYLIYG